MRAFKKGKSDMRKTAKAGGGGLREPAKRFRGFKSVTVVVPEKEQDPVVLSREAYDALRKAGAEKSGANSSGLRERIADLEDRIAIAETRGEPTFPTPVLDRLLSGEHPVKVFREHRGLSQKKLAETARQSQSYVAEIEAGRKPGSAAALKAIAEVLGVPMENLVED